MGIISPEQRGLASAVNSIIWRLPNSITTVVGGWLMQQGYLDLPIFLAVGFYVVSISAFYVVFRDVRPTS
jgi:predicted MFS family arabinose efflux permease